MYFYRKPRSKARKTFNMKKQELARLFYREVEKIIQASEMELITKVASLNRLLNLLFVEITREEKLQFTTLFARIAYTCQQHQLDKMLRFRIYHFRKQARRPNASDVAETYELGLKVLCETIAALYDQAIPDTLLPHLPSHDFNHLRPAEIKGFRSRVRVVVLEDDPEQQQFVAFDEQYPAQQIRLQYNIPDRNENFKPTIQAIRQFFQFPLLLNLLDVEIDQAGVYRPAAFVIEPDYLIDVSAISECFKDTGAEARLFLLKKYLPFEYTKYLMIGNIANFFLDELMSNPEATFPEIFPKVFRLNPLAFVLFEDALVREIMQTSQKHYVNLKRMVIQEFAAQDIDPKASFLEPSFYSEEYGLQGRLDVFYKKDEKESAIVELKSGRPFKPNRHGISNNHYTQTLLYDLIVRSVFGKPLDPKNYILYSGVDDRQLRYAPRVKAQQYEALQLRNQLLSIEQQLMQLGKEGSSNILNQLRPQAMPTAKGFLQRDLQLFERVYEGMNALQKTYFHAFSAFIAREQQLAKTGVQGLDNVNGLAALWLNDLQEKETNFEIISHLKIKQCKTKDEDPIIIFEKTPHTNPLANFRKGDIAVLYPYGKETDNVLSNQIFKCTVIAITKTDVLVRLRSKQFNDSIFQEEHFWNIEHDMMDNSFTAMYRSLFQFARFSEDKKQLYLTQRPPAPSSNATVVAPRELTIEQQAIFQKMIRAEEYFLLWGPPGTGKTSMMLKHAVAYLLNETDESILLLAYTNRAVDEICSAIEEIDDYIKEEYIRISSRYSTNERFQNQLLDQKIAKINNRKELKETIVKHRIYVATVASFNSKTELLKLKKFDRVIIDEASQILEPLLMGLLPHFPRVVLVGDHKQLPAVVVQSAEVSKTNSPALQEIGLSNLRDSLFERLYKRCKSQGWDWAYAQLSHQGRMHQDIMDFPNEQFYESTLKTLPPELEISIQQNELLDYIQVEGASQLETLLSQRRVLFFPTQADATSLTGKTNLYEAKMVGEIVKNFQEIYFKNGKSFGRNSIGIITPYRAQIAQIRQELIRQEINVEELTIDTVERYQGGAREIILISLCLNQPTQLRSLVSLSDEGVDRKLNVALTRARKHLVILGNQAILEQNAVYARLMAFCEE